MTISCTNFIFFVLSASLLCLVFELLFWSMFSDSISTYILTPIGHFDVLISNILPWHCLRFVTSAHILALRKFICLTLLLGFIFLTNQIDETFAPMGIDSYPDCSVHMSHLVLCSVVFCISLIFLFADNPASDSLMRFAVLYWHLVEICELSFYWALCVFNFYYLVHNPLLSGHPHCTPTLFCDTPPTFICALAQVSHQISVVPRDRSPCALQIGYFSHYEFATDSKRWNELRKSVYASGIANYAFLLSLHNKQLKRSLHVLDSA